MSNPVTHWWVQRLSSLVLIPLSLWLIYAGLSMAGADYETARAFMSRPTNLMMAVGLTLVAMYHSVLGIEVIAEDYLSPGLGKFCINVARLGCSVGALAVIWAAYQLSFGA